MRTKAELNQIIEDYTNLELFDELKPGEKTELEVAKRERAEMDLVELQQKEIKRRERGRRARNVNKRAKRDEEIMCKELGLKWLGVKRKGVHCLDGIDDMFGINITTSKRVSKFHEMELLDTEVLCTQGRIAIAILRKPGQRIADAIVQLRYRDWRDLHGES